MGVIQPITLTLADDGCITLRSPRDEEATEMIGYRKRVHGETQFLAAEPEDISDDIEQQVAFIRKHNDEPGSICLAAFDEESHMIGLLNFSRDKRRKLRHQGWFGMTVLRAHWGRGIGSALVQAMLDWAAPQSEIEKVGLSVLASNERAVRLYRKFDFIEEGRRRRTFKLGPGHYDDEILMARFLHEAVDAV